MRFSISIISIITISISFAGALVSCNTEPPMPSPVTPTTGGSNTTQVLSPFTTLVGGSVMAIAPGERIVALHASYATFWDDDKPVEVTLPNVPVAGSRWTPDGKLQVGLGTLDLTARAWTADPKLAAWKPASVAWLPNGSHVAMLIGPQPQPLDRKTSPRVVELVVVDAATGAARGRTTLDLKGALSIAASNDRVLVTGNGSALYDLDAKLVVGPDKLPGFASRVHFGADLFAMTKPDGVTLLHTDGSVFATWSPEIPKDTTLNDAIAVANGVIALDFAGTVYVGCIAKGHVQTVLHTSAGTFGMQLQLVGDRLVVATGGADPLRWATFSNPCH